MPRNEGLEIKVKARPVRHRAVRDVAPGFPDLPYVRLTQRKRPPPQRRGWWLVLALVLLAHALLGWFVWKLLHPPYNQNERGVTQVTLIEPAAKLPPPPPLVAPPPLEGQPAPPQARAAPPRPVHQAPPAKGAITATLEPSPQAKPKPSLHLYKPNGQVRVPTSPSRRSAPAFRTPELKGSHISSGKSPVTYQPTMFNQYWAPLDENLAQKTVGRAFDKLVEKTTVAKMIHLPGGITIGCAFSPFLLSAGCGPRRPPPAASDDHSIRLSMPPSETLTGKKVVVPKSASSAPGGPPSS